jgi:hypothetical protein
MASLQNSACRFVLLLVFGATLAGAQSSTATLRLLTHADQVRHLSMDEAALGGGFRVIQLGAKVYF